MSKTSKPYLINTAKSKARIATLLTALLALLALFFISFTTQTLNNTLEEGILVNFGNSLVGQGDVQPDTILEQEQSENTDYNVESTTPTSTPEKVIEPTKTVKEEQPPLTQKEESVALPKKEKEKEQPKKENEATKQPNTATNQSTSPKPEPSKPSLNKRALYPGKSTNQSSGEGITGDAGDQGSTEGVTEREAYNGTNYGLGSSGVQFSLAGRKLVTPPSVNDQSNAVGKITVKIKVDQRGKVISASLGKPTTISNNALLTKTIAAAKQAKFDFNKDAAEEQFGTITFVFKVQ